MNNNRTWWDELAGNVSQGWERYFYSNQWAQEELEENPILRKNINAILDIATETPFQIQSPMRFSASYRYPLGPFALLKVTLSFGNKTYCLIPSLLSFGPQGVGAISGCIYSGEEAPESGEFLELVGIQNNFDWDGRERYLNKFDYPDHLPEKLSLVTGFLEELSWGLGQTTLEHGQKELMSTEDILNPTDDSERELEKVINKLWQEWLHLWREVVADY